MTVKVRELKAGEVVWFVMNADDYVLDKFLSREKALAYCAKCAKDRPGDEYYVLRAQLRGVPWLPRM